MKYILVLFFLVSSSLLIAQGKKPGSGTPKKEYSTTSKKAIKLFEESEDYVVRREYEKAIEVLQSALKKDDDFAEAHLRIGTCYRTVNEPEKAEYHLKKALELRPQDKNLHAAYYVLGEIYFRAHKYDEAISQVRKFLDSRPSNKNVVKDAQKLIANAEFAKEKIKTPLSFTPVAIEEPLNKFPLQYFPVLTADQKTMIFTRRLGFHMQHDEDIFISNRSEDGSWSDPVSISDKINTPENEGTCTISADGKMLIYTSCLDYKGMGGCDLYYSFKIGNEWAEPKNIGRNVNSSAWESQPSLSADGRTLYFVSNRKGGYGGRDIWVSYMNNEGEWSVAKNLGPGINTPEDEISPYIHVNGQTLYFASKGYLGFGGYDIYFTELNSGQWSIPENLGYPVNTVDDQVSLFITADGKKAFYSYEERREKSFVSSYLYTFDVPEDIQVKYKSSYVHGKIYDAQTKKLLQAKVDLYDIKNDTLISAVQSDPQTGEYLIVLSEGSEYALYVGRQGYLFESVSFNYSDNGNPEPVTMDVYLKPIKKGESVTLKNIFFGFDSYDIEVKSFTELERIKTFLQNNSGLKIEISGHTDDKGSAEYNNRLSLNRAKSVYDYLIKAGVPTEALSFKGYGASQPKVPNTSEENRSQNRRIDFIILE